MDNTYDDDLQYAEQVLNSWEPSRMSLNALELPSDYDMEVLRSCKFKLNGANNISKDRQIFKAYFLQLFDSYHIEYGTQIF